MLLAAFLLLGVLSNPSRAQEPDPVVHALLFYSPSCPHCHEVINTYLIPLQNEYGRKLVILGLDTSQPWANELFYGALRHYEVPEEKWAVPFMLVDDQVLVGGQEIPTLFSAILEEGLASGGIDLPDFPALMEFMAEQNLLDPRYPDRRIARQAAPEGPEEEEEAVQESPTSPAQEADTARTWGQEGDTAQTSGQEGEETGAPEGQEPDSMAAAPEDSTPPGPPTETRDTAPALPEAQADSPLPSPPSRELPSPPSGDTLEEPGVGIGSEEEAPDSQPSASPGGTPAPSSPEDTLSGVPPEGQASGGGLGLQDAATRLESMDMWDRFNQDPAGNTLSVLVLLGMLASLVFTASPARVRRAPWPSWIVPLLVVTGAGVAAYLSFVEVTQVEAVCGPVGDCNTVNQSEYAILFGVLPVGILGLMGYGAIFLLWLFATWASGALRRGARLGLWAAALFGVLFSIYLTFLEPFVIGATCAWCLSSAIIMTLLLWDAAPLAAEAWPGRDQDESREKV